MACRSKRARLNFDQPDALDGELLTAATRACPKPRRSARRHYVTVPPMAERYVLPAGTGPLEDSVHAVLLHVETHNALACSASA